MEEYTVSCQLLIQAKYRTTLLSYVATTLPYLQLRLPCCQTNVPCQLLEVILGQRSLSFCKRSAGTAMTLTPLRQRSRNGGKKSSKRRTTSQRLTTPPNVSKSSQHGAKTYSKRSNTQRISSTKKALSNLLRATNPRVESGR